MIDPELKAYITAQIFPRYAKFYSHNLAHIQHVINNALMLAESYNLNEDMAYTMAAFHDVGLNVDRENHEYASGQCLAQDHELPKFFITEQIHIMQEAVEDHRGSRKEPPRNIYGKVLSDSDRDFDIKVLARRQLATSLKNCPEFTTFTEHFEHCHHYILQRINSAGNFNLWTNHPVLIARRKDFERDYLNKEYARSVYQAEWDRITADGTKDLIINFYEDY